MSFEHACCWCRVGIAAEEAGSEEGAGPFIARKPFLEWCRRMPALSNTVRTIVAAAAGPHAAAAAAAAATNDSGKAGPATTTTGGVDGGHAHSHDRATQRESRTAGKREGKSVQGDSEDANGKNADHGDDHAEKQGDLPDGDCAEEKHGAEGSANKGGGKPEAETGADSDVQAEPSGGQRAGLLPKLVPLQGLSQAACLLTAERTWALAASGFLPPARCV